MITPPALRLRGPDRAGIEVDVSPREPKLVAPAKARVQGEQDEWPVLGADRLVESDLFLLRHVADPGIVLTEEFDAAEPADGVGVGFAIADRDVEHPAEEGEFPVDARVGEAVGLPPLDDCRDITRDDRPNRPLAEGRGPHLPVPGQVLRVAEPPHDVLRLVTRDRILEEDVLAADRLGEESALCNLRLALLVDLHRKRALANLLAVLAAVLVLVVNPPDARARRALEYALILRTAALLTHAGPSSSIWISPSTGSVPQRWLAPLLQAALNLAQSIAGRSPATGMAHGQFLVRGPPPHGREPHAQHFGHFLGGQ